MECWSNAVLLFRLAILELLQLLDLSFVICSGGCRIVLWWFHYRNHSARD
jgi:hypothetical protein